MREAEMDTIGELITRALQTPDDDRALGDGARRSRDAVPEVPAVPGVAGLKALARRSLSVGCARAPVAERSFAPDGALARALPDFEPRAGQVEMAAAVAQRVRARRRAARRGRHRHRQDARLSRPRHPEPRARAHLHRHQEPPGADLLQGHPGAARRARHSVHRHLHEGARELPVPAQARSADTTAPARRSTTCSCRSSASGPPGPRPAIAPSSQDLPEDLPFWNEVSATAETCLGTECPRYDDCFVTRMRQRAAASDVVIVNHHLLCADAAVRQNAFGEVIPACSRAIIDEAHQLEDVATQYFGFSVSNYRVEELARDVETARRLGGDRGAGRPGGDRQGGRAAARSRARVLHRARLRASRRRARRRTKSACAPPPSRSGRRCDAAAQPHRRARHRRVDARAAANRLRRDAEDDATDRRAGRLDATRRRDAGAPRRRAARRAAVPAPRRRRRLRLLRRVPRPRHLPARVADRRLRDRPRAAARSDAHDGPDVGDADRRRRVRLHPRRGSASATPTRSGCRRSSTSRGRRSCTCRRGCPIRGRPSSPSPPDAR